jgi:phage host-nuclease inhibitor protein Gam
MNRIKLKSAAVTTRIEMETLVREITSLKLNEKLLTNAMDAEIQGVRDSYEGRLGAISQVLAEKLETVREWAETNPGEFIARRSIDLGCGTIGFRTGKPKLKTLARWTTDAVLDALRGLRWGRAYIRVKEEINKEQIIADATAELLDKEDLQKIGAQIVQDEIFFVEPKCTRVEPREIAQVA